MPSEREVLEERRQEFGRERERIKATLEEHVAIREALDKEDEQLRHDLDKAGLQLMAAWYDLYEWDIAAASVEAGEV